MHRALRIAIASIALIAVAHLLDQWAWVHLVNSKVYDRDFGRMLRVIGFLPLWFVIAITSWLLTRNRRDAIMLALAPTLGGALAEVLKIALRRERPNLHDGSYVFRVFADQPWSTKAIGLPSSHALVAFAGAWMLCRIYPRASVVWIALAVGCAITRVQAHAHFLSDVTVAGVAAFVLVEIMERPRAATVPR